MNNDVGLNADLVADVQNDLLNHNAEVAVTDGWDAWPQDQQADNDVQQHMVQEDDQ